ncbi:CoA transferase [uncultured Sneathiella sp.]|jgi:formyl-CoA transferase|uniref:CaiB/BaiF CoA transferase family protein n=1 Tax=uncultured Sneathiella sp. TaxID=879315 RepID=UPI0030DA1EAB|tara:strand:+ start:26339 stop:27544 length:1206 start_codon:yes stop_codon:yes gene_type:complete
MRAYEGLKVVDFTQVLAGPISTQMFSLLGADVVKIEAPIKGDQLRTTLTDAEMVAKRLSPAFLTVNLGKKSLAIDLKSEKGREIVYKLIDDADVVVENFRPGVAKKLGIDYETLKKRKPDLVYCSISGYGQVGPRSGDKAYDSAIQAASGLFTLNGHEESGPTRIGIMVIDMFTGANAAFAISSALYRREKTGKGQYVDVAMYDSALMIAAAQMADFMVRGNIPPLIGNESPTRQPTAGVFETSDGIVLIATITPDQNIAMLKAAGLGHMLDDPRFATFEARQANLKAGLELVGEAMRTKATTEWIDIMNKAGVVVQAVRTLGEATSDPQLEHRGILVKAENVHGFDEALRLVGAPFIANEDSPMNVAAPPGKVGQHTEEVLRGLGYDDSEIAKILALNEG